MSVSTATPLWPQACCHSADEGSLRSWADQVQTERVRGLPVGTFQEAMQMPGWGVRVEIGAGMGCLKGGEEGEEERRGRRAPIS